MKTINLKDDYEITLLTVEEYEQYKDCIPLVNQWWWLRSPGYGSNYAAYVLISWLVRSIGLSIFDTRNAVRPVLITPDISHLSIGESFIALGNRWVVIDDDGIAISQDVITHRLYDRVSNLWETSELKRWLEDWAKEGETEEVMNYNEVLSEKLRKLLDAMGQIADIASIVKRIE